MNILLINPPFSMVYEKTRVLKSSLPPMGLLYLAAIAEDARHKVEIFDMQQEKASINEIEKKVKGKDLIGITCATSTANITYDITKIIKKVNPNTKVIIGGPHPSALPEEPLKRGGVDIVIKGEGEYTFQELIDCLERGDKLKQVQGICYKENGKIIYTKPRTQIDNLDSLPYPAYHLVDLKKYFYPYQKEKRLVGILTSRGCYGNCSFCNKNIFGKNFARRSPENVLDEMSYVVDRHKVKEFLIYDDNFTMIKNHVQDICQWIIKEKLDVSLSCFNGIRANNVDKDIILSLEKAGCYLIGYGVESGVQRILDSVNKGVKIEQIKKAVRLTKSSSIQIVGYFIIGFPQDTEKTIKSTIKFARSLNILAKFSLLTPNPGTEIFNELKKENRILTYDWSKYGYYNELVFKHPNLSHERILALYKDAYRAIYTNPKLIAEEIFSIRSLTQIKNLLKYGRDIYF